MTVDRSVFSLNLLEYCADFFIVPVCIAIMFYFNTMMWAALFGYLLVGALSWTLYEYLLHRYVLHGRGSFGNQHDDHHVRPKALIGNPPWMTFVITGFFLGVTWVLTGYNIASAYTGGVEIGYLIYALVHVNLHHRNPAKYGKMMNVLFEHHCSHHRGGRKNFGVSSTLWDHVFHTKA